MSDYFQFIERIEINPTEICNLQCSFCPRGHGYPNQNLHMSHQVIDRVRYLLDQSGYTNKVSITGRGEPTLAKNIKYILSTLLENDPKYHCYMYTNGKKLYELREFIPLFWKVYVDVYDTGHEEYNHVRALYSEYSNVEVLHKPDNGSGYQAFKMMSNRGGVLPHDSEAAQHACAFIFQKLFINWNGDYNLCCDDWAKQIKMSNIFDQDLLDYVNNNPLLKKYRLNHILGTRSCLDICKTCDRKHQLKQNKLTSIKEMQV